jgi:membrane associated rhomboid family serine protease
MIIHRTGRQLCAIPLAATYVLIAANIAVYALCTAWSGTAAIPGEVMFRAGAMDDQAIARHDYWRLLTSGFLHFNLVHLATNMLCLALWGGPLEKRVGALYFLLIYLGAIVCGALLQHFAQPGRYLLAGASGAVSGILGALLCLWILARIELSAGFFVVNIALNAVLALGVPGIAWRAHAGGFVGGLVLCALLDLIERLNALILRCKFPEFVKVNVFVLVSVVALLIWRAEPAMLSDTAASVPTWLIAGGIAGLVAIKAIDLVLSMRKGLAVVAVALSVANGAALLAAGRTLAPLLASLCLAPRAAANLVGLGEAICADPAVTLHIAAAALTVGTLLLYAHPLRRGLTDVGFVGAALRAERRRRAGI